MSKILTVTLNPSIDKTIILKKSLDHHEYSVAKESSCAGGKGVNVARALNTLKVVNLATGMLAANGDFAKLLTKDKIKNNFLKINGYLRTNYQIIYDHSQDSHRILNGGPIVSLKEIKFFKQKFKKLLKNADCIVFSGRNANQAPDQLYAELICMANRKKIKTVLDTSGMALKKGFSARPWMVKPNLVEAEEFLGYKLKTASDYKKALLRFQHLGVSVATISLGASGVVGLYQNELWKVRPPRVQSVNDVGCGDAFIAGFLDSFLKKDSFSMCLQNGVAVATASVLSHNSADFKMADVKRLSKNIQINKL